MYIDSRNMAFLHFGTLAEVLDHLKDDKGGWLAGNYFTTIPSCGTCDVTPSAVILVAKLQHGVSIGAGSLVFDCTLNSSIQIGVSLCGHKGSFTGVHWQTFHRIKRRKSLEWRFTKKMIKSRIGVELGSNDGHFVMVVIWLLRMFTTSNMVALLKLFWSF
jgi:hypothetical protein